MKRIEALERNSPLVSLAKIIYCLLVFLLQALLHALLIFQFKNLNTDIALVITSFLTALSTFWVVRKKINGSSLFVKLGKLFIIIFIFIKVIALISSLYNKNLGIKRFDYAYGQYLPNYSILLLNPIGQGFARRVYSTFSISTFHLMAALEDGANVGAFKTFIESDTKDCKKHKKANCFVDIYRSKEKLLTKFSTYHILMVAVGANIILKERKERLRLKLSKEGDASIESTFQLAKTLNISLSGLLKSLTSLNTKNSLESKLLYNMELRTSQRFASTSDIKMGKLILKALKHKSCDSECKAKVERLKRISRALQLEIEKLAVIPIKKR